MGVSEFPENGWFVRFSDFLMPILTGNYEKFALTEKI